MLPMLPMILAFVTLVVLSVPAAPPYGWVALGLSVVGLLSVVLKWHL